MTIERYVHHGREVSVISAIKGRHRENCLCLQGCKHFQPGEPNHCEIASANYALCVKYGLTAPVGECPKYESGAGT